jgi:hypothetical protein
LRFVLFLSHPQRSVGWRSLEDHGGRLDAFGVLGVNGF